MGDEQPTLFSSAGIPTLDLVHEAAELRTERRKADAEDEVEPRRTQTARGVTEVTRRGARVVKARSRALAAASRLTLWLSSRVITCANM